MDQEAKAHVGDRRGSHHSCRLGRNRGHTNDGASRQVLSQLQQLHERRLPHVPELLLHLVRGWKPDVRLQPVLLIGVAGGARSWVTWGRAAALPPRRFFWRLAMGRLTTRLAAFMWPTVAIVAVASAAVTRIRAERRASPGSLRVDSLVHVLNSTQAALQVQLTTGDSLPDAILVDRTGRAHSLREAIRHGVRYIYLYKRSCPACQALVGHWTLEADSLRLIHLAIEGSVDTLIGDGPGHYAWRRETSTASDAFAGGVPALLSVDRSGTVLAAAYGLRAVTRMGAHFHLLNAEAAHSVVQ